MTDMIPRVEKATAADLAGAESLLSACGLPRDGVRELAGRLLVAVETEDTRRMVVGCAGLEVHDVNGERHAVLRSLAVTPRLRGRGVARELIAALLAEARTAGCSEAWLLTRTVERMAARHGFTRVSREDAPADLLRTTEFLLDACSSATIMRRAL